MPGMCCGQWGGWGELLQGLIVSSKILLTRLTTFVGLMMRKKDVGRDCPLSAFRNLDLDPHFRRHPTTGWNNPWA